MRGEFDGCVVLDRRLLPSGGVEFFAILSRSDNGVYAVRGRTCWRFRSSGYGSGAVGGLVGGTGKVGIGGGREKPPSVTLPAEPALRGGVAEADSILLIRRGPTVGVSGASAAGRKKSSSSGRPWRRPSIAYGINLCWISRNNRRRGFYFWESLQLSSSGSVGGCGVNMTLTQI